MGGILSPSHSSISSSQSESVDGVSVGSLSLILIDSLTIVSMIVIVSIDDDNHADDTTSS
jgi:hypothetical protein